MDDFEKRLNHVLVDTFNHILKYEETSLRRILSVPVTIAEAHMLEAVAAQENQATTVSKIASLLKIATPTATVAIKKLENKGFITKAPCEQDGRRAIISLTDLGKQIERTHRLFHEKMARNISGQFAGPEKEILLKAITKLSEFFKEKVEA
ncbi:MAG: MarR family transcriptional regulator [Peptococcaceae bacterium]|jgi:DNA-binding MarR family transcriptional regulator|nr:MarR family transcriptional regulator [Peptococcaceae bacterium]MDR2736744.1 MarR family transcriptional regulator [Gracilibacteraceae bacterium]